MAAKCGGLPLAIIVLGGILSRKEFQEWLAVKEYIWREVKEDSMSVISPLLDLSYNDLSNDLKPCFLYLCIFPEDALICVTKLMKLWVAEELIPIDEEGRTLEEVSECYFKELLGRNLVQTVERNWRMTSICRVHDLLRDLALKKARETNFLRVYDQIRSSSSLPTTSCRRFVVHSDLVTEELPNHSLQKVRSLHLLNFKSSIHYQEGENINVSMVWRFRLLRVLELEGLDLRGDERKLRFVEGVREMMHLRYFGLKNTDVDELPNSIGNLKALQTLMIEFDIGSTILNLPKDICKLKELRHLEGFFAKEDFPNLAGLSNLQTLILKFHTITNGEVTEIDSNFFATLNSLRTLRMNLQWLDKTSIEPLLTCKEIIELKIMSGKVREVPKDIHKYLTKLKYLHIRLANLDEDPIRKLEMLPNLVALHLSYDAEKTTRWAFTANGFPQLEFLEVKSAVEMELLVEERAMPRLKFLCLGVFIETLLPERFLSLPGKKAMIWKF